MIHADEVKKGQKARIETFIVGQNIGAGERLQWIVEGGKYKASYLLSDGPSNIDKDPESSGLLISEVRFRYFLKFTALMWILDRCPGL